MSIIEQFLKLFVTKDSEKYSDEQIQKLLQKAVSPTVKKYNSGLKQHKSLFNKNENLNRLIVLRCYAYELFYDVCKGDLQRDIYGRRINVIETALLRCEIATDENIVLLNYGYGLGVTSNLRLMIESFALAINNKTAIHSNTRIDSGFLLAFVYKLFTDFCYFLSSCE